MRAHPWRPTAGSRFIRRNRPPRVHITYEDPYNAERRIELPFVMGVLSDLSGNNSSVEKPDVAERKFLEFDMDNFENRMAAIEPGAAFTVANKLGDGAGEKLVGRPAFPQDGRLQPGRGGAPGARARQLLQAREQLANLLRYMDGKVAAEDQIKALLKDPQLMAALSKRAPAAAEPAEAQSDDNH